MRTPAIAIGALFMWLTGCAPWSRGVLGPGHGYALGLWRGGEFRLLDFRTPSGALQTATERQARARWHLDGQWMVAEYRAAAPPNGSTVLVADLRAIDGRGDVADLDGVIAAVRRGDLAFLVGQEAATRAQVASSGPDRLEEGEGAPSLTPRSDVVGVELDGAELTISTTAALVVQAMRMPCTGAPEPPALTAVDGLTWSRTHRVRLDGTTLGVTTTGPTRVGLHCDPRVAEAASSRR